jgi:hypothetical protein
MTGSVIWFLFFTIPCQAHYFEFLVLVTEFGCCGGGGGEGGGKKSIENILFPRL